MFVYFRYNRYMQYDLIALFRELSDHPSYMYCLTINYNKRTIPKYSSYQNRKKWNIL